MSEAGAFRPPSTRKEKRRERKRQRRGRARREAAALARAAAEALATDPEEQRRLREIEEAEAAASERARREFEDAERRWLEAAGARAAAAAEEAKRKQSLLEASIHEKSKDDRRDESEEGEEWEYVEEGPAEIIWEGNEITVKKKMVKVAKKVKDKLAIQEEEDRPTSNPLPPQSVAFASQRKESSLSAQEVLEKVAQETPNFGTEQDKAHCPFQLKTGTCRFGVRCSRVHFYPDKSCTLLFKNMYIGPGLALEQDESLEFTDEEVEQSYEEFYEDVHTEFLKFGELVNFKVCRNGSFHLRGNVYVHYKSLDSAILAYNSMNGRYFGGKQITCDFVSVTRWKAAICGEYMRSRLKTCSRGTACNFIHCFRNPGGDYEWADWDNPPPKYWIRKMAALFGPSDDDVYDNLCDVPNLERLRSSDRKRLRSSDRHDSRRSRDDLHAQKRHTPRDYSYSKEESSSYSIKNECRGRREPSANHGGRAVEDNTGTHTSTKENGRGSRKHKHEKRHKSSQDDDDITHGTQEYLDEDKRDKNKSKKHGYNQQESVEPGSSDWPAGFTDRGIGKSRTSSKSTGWFSNDGKGGRQSSDDPDLLRHHSTLHKSSGEEHSTKRRGSSKHHAEYDSSDGDKDGGRGKSRKCKTSTQGDHRDYSDDRWEVTYNDVDSDDEKGGGRVKSRKRKTSTHKDYRDGSDDRWAVAYSEADFDDEKDGGRVKSRKGKTITHEEYRNDYDDRWVVTYSDVDSDEETRYQRSSSRSTEVGRNDGKSCKKSRHNSESVKHKESEEDTWY